MVVGITSAYATVMAVGTAQKKRLATPARQHHGVINAMLVVLSMNRTQGSLFRKNVLSISAHATVMEVGIVLEKRL